MSSMTFGQTINALRLCFATGVSSLIWGQPGIGKSDLVRKAASSMPYTITPNDELAKFEPRLAEVYYEKDDDGKITNRVRRYIGKRVFDVRLALCSPTDLKGIPVYSSSDRNAVWVMTGMFPADPNRVLMLERMLMDHHRDGDKSVAYETHVDELISALHDQHSVLFLDEIGQAPATVQSAAFGLVLDRKIQTYSLPADVNIVAASNNYDDRAMVNKMPTPLLSRFIHIQMESNFKEWEKWAADSDIAPDVIAYLAFNPEHFHKFDPNSLRGAGAAAASLTFPCPRTWEFASRLIRSADEGHADLNTLEAVLFGTVGGTAAMSFIAWRTHYREMINPDEIFEGRVKREQVKFGRNEKRGDKMVWIEDPSLQYAFILSAFQKLNAMGKSEGADKKDWVPSEKIVKYITRFVDFIHHKETEREWLAVVFRRAVHDEFNGIGRAFMKVPKFKEIARELNNMNAFKSA